MSVDENWGPDASSVATHTGVAVFAVDTDRVVSYVNEPFLARYDHSQETVLGADYTVIEPWVADGFAELRGAIDDVARGVSNRSQASVVVTGTDGQQRRQTVTVTPVVDDGALAGALAVFRADESDSGTEDVSEMSQRYTTLVEQSRDGVTITQDRTNVFVNERFAQLLGYERQALCGESFLKPIAPSEYDLVERRYRKRIRGDEPSERYELELEQKDGTPLLVELNVTQIQYDGEPAVMATYRDITERKRREETLRQFRRAIETAPHSIFLTDSEGTIEYVNPAFEEVTGYSADAVLGRTPEILNSGEMRTELYEELWETITDGEVWEGYIVNRRASGDLYHAHETIAPITDDEGEITGFVAIQTDISERIERERLVDTLDRVLRHNLRNRLNVVEAHGTLIRTSDTADQSEHVDKILKSVDRLLETSQKGRELITFLSQPARDQPLDAAAIARDAVAAAREHKDECTISTDLPAAAHVSAVPELGDAIEELVRNAIEHNDREHPTVSVQVVNEEETVEIHVADDGPGISKMERQILDETADVDQLYHGSGFGLWLVYWIVRQSHGSLDIADRPDRGTVVTLSFDRVRRGDETA
ncbi:PAS domain S-box protein [Salinibaculum rarum]|uniref:PAS domain S-box protein n=1 Tax=Salinibaculum rarum TaxID=3058903 RepID=UPI00265FB49E|nr:PAS domain S-box protein [Salinibaculum sp. KK48]